MDGKKKSSRPPPINARAETIETSGMFRNAVKPERCIIPADGFFEWKGIQGEKTKQPMHIRLKDHTIFGFAGLYTKLTKDKLSGTAVILTTTPDELWCPSTIGFIVAAVGADDALDISPYDAPSESLIAVTTPHSPMSRWQLEFWASHWRSISSGLGPQLRSRDGDHGPVTPKPVVQARRVQLPLTKLAIIQYYLDQ